MPRGCVKLVRLLVDTRTVDYEVESDESEDRESLKDRVRRGPLLGALLWITLFAGITWVVLNAIVQIRNTSGYAHLFTSEAAANFWIWGQAVAGIAYSIFLTALGSYVVMWLALREEASSHQPDRETRA